MEKRLIRTVDALVCLLLTGGALLAYVMTCGRSACPGLSVSLAAQHIGALPRLSPDNPLWHLASWLFTRLPLVESGVTRLNLFSAVTGALAVGALYLLATGIVSRLVKTGRENAARVAVAARLAGVGASLFLAFSVPFWMAATRALPLTFDALLLLALGLLLLRYLDTDSPLLLCALAFLLGVGIVEFITLVLFAPLFAATIALHMWRNEAFKGRLLACAGACGVAGLFLYLLAAWRFNGTEGYELREYSGYFQILWIMWRDQVWSLTRSLPRVGWLIVVLVTVIPALTVPAIARRGLNGERDWAYYLLHLVLSALAVAVLLNAAFAPWPMSQGLRVQISPYLIHAALFGYLIAYWYLLPSAIWPRPETSWHLFLRRASGPLVIVPALALLLMAPFRNVESVDSRSGDFIDEYARLAIRSLEGREWLVTAGVLDDYLRIAAKDLDVAVEILNLHARPGDVSRRSLDEKFDSARLRNLAQIGMWALVSEWLQDDPAAVNNVALMAEPDFWVGADVTPVPNRLLFLGTRQADALDVDSLLDLHRAFWSDLDPLLAAEPPPGIGRRYHEYVRRHAGMVANNLGFLFQDLGRDEAAFEAYQASRRIDPANASALLNQSAMLSAGFAHADADAVRRDLSVLTQESKRQQLWSLSRHYGYVRSPDAFGQLGFTWALSGRPGIAAAGLRRALSLATGADRERMALTLADIYYMDKDREQSARLYEEVLAKDPASPDALLGMARVSRHRGALKEAEAYLKRLDATGALRTETVLEWATLNVAGRNLPQARIALEELVALERNNLRAWDMLARVRLAQNDSDGVNDCLDALRLIRGSDGTIYSIEALVALQQRDLTGARRLFERALRVRPQNVRVHEALLRLDLTEGRAEDAERHARELLKVDANSAWGNYVLGTTQIAAHEYDLAEDSLQRSLAADRLPPALNDLAWLKLEIRKAPAEAEELAREALQIDKTPHQPWDTLAMALLAQDRLDEAEKALGEAISRTRADPEVYLHAAELFVRKGENKQAREILKMLTSQRELISAELQERIEALAKALPAAP